MMIKVDKNYFNRQLTVLIDLEVDSVLESTFINNKNHLMKNQLYNLNVTI